MYNFDKKIERRNTNCMKYDSDSSKGQDVIPMWVADMDFETLPEVKEALVKRAQYGVFGYQIVPDSYYEAVINWMNDRHDFHIEKDWIVTTSGVVNAIHLAVQAFTKENDHILLMKPVYYPFDSAVERNNRIIVECPLVYDGNHYACDFELFEKCIIDHDVKLFVLCNPHNPIGKVWTKNELYQIGMICKKHHVIIVSDEIHMDFVYPGHQHVTMYNVDESFKDFTIVCTAPSKTFNLAALETSNIIIYNEELREQFKQAKDRTGQFDPNVFGLDACEAAYRYGAEWVDELVAYLYANIQYMKDYFNRYMPELKVVEPEGLYLIWVDFRALHMSDHQLEDFMLNKAHLWLDEGYIFGKGGSGFERFNVACPRSTLKRALHQLRDALTLLK